MARSAHQSNRPHVALDYLGKLHPHIHESGAPNWARVVDNDAYLKKGGSISCGHSRFVWDRLKVASGGEMILCDRCGKYLAVILGLPWVTQDRIGYSKRFHAPKTNHLTGKWLMPVEARVTVD